MVKWTAPLLLCATALAAPAQQHTGSICGTVENELGQPAANVSIIAMPAALGGLLPRFKTDASGHYCATGLMVPNTYTLTADDPAAGYPSLAPGFYNQRPSQHVELTPQRPIATFNWRIPYKAASLRIHPTDASTGRPLTSIRYSLVLKGNPAIGITTASSPADLPILLPPDTDLLLEVKSPGYRPWPLDGSSGRLINAPSGAQADLDVALDPGQD